MIEIFPDLFFQKFTPHRNFQTTDRKFLGSTYHEHKEMKERLFRTTMHAVFDVESSNCMWWNSSFLSLFFCRFDTCADLSYTVRCCAGTRDISHTRENAVEEQCLMSAFPTKKTCVSDQCMPNVHHLENVFVCS